MNFLGVKPISYFIGNFQQNQGQEIHPRKGIPPGITSLFTRIQAGEIKTRGKILRTVTTPGSAASNLIY
jgi:hypothetical protein